MPLSRRDFGFLFPALAQAANQQTAPAQPQPAPVLTGKIYHNDQIPYTGNDDKKGRRFLLGSTHKGFQVEVHETILGPGKLTHEPHKHEHEEMIVVVQGTFEVHIEGDTQTAEAGSVVCFGSNQMHNARNAGDGPCRYYVIELRGEAAG